MSDKSYHHGNLRAALLAAALDQVERDGQSALNVSKLARKVGVSQPAAYRHFANKQALKIELGIMGYERLRNQIDTALVQQAGEGSWSQTLEIIATAYVNFALHNRELTRLMFSLRERRTHAELYTASKSIAEALYTLVKEAKQAGRLINEDVDKTVRIIWSAVHGLAILLIDEQMPFVTASESALEIHIKEMVRVLGEGLWII